MSRTHWMPVLILVFLIAGCDVMGTDPEPITLGPDRIDPVTFQFVFSVSDPGDTVVAQSTNTIDPADLLVDTFQPDEILSARVISADLDRTQPTGIGLSDLVDFAELEVTGGGSGVRVAEQSSFPNQPTVDLDVYPDADLASLMRQASSLGAELTVEPKQADQYRVQVSVQFEITVEGI